MKSFHGVFLVFFASSCLFLTTAPTYLYRQGPSSPSGSVGSPSGVLSSLPPFRGVASQLDSGVLSVSNETTHDGDLVLDGNQTLLIENSVYNQRGALYLEGNATFIMRNATLIIDQPSPFHYPVQVADTATLSLSSNSHLTSSFGTLLTATGSSSVVVDGSDVTVFELGFAGSSRPVIAHSSVPKISLLSYSELDARGAEVGNLSVSAGATANLTNVELEFLSLSGEPHVLLRDCLVSEVRLTFSGDVAGVSLTPREHASLPLRNNVTGSRDYDVSLENTTVGGWSLTASSSSIDIEASTLTTVILSEASATFRSSSFGNVLAETSNVTFSGVVRGVTVIATQSHLSLHGAQLTLDGELTVDNSNVLFIDSVLERSLDVRVVDTSSTPVGNASVVVYTEFSLLSHHVTSGSGQLSVDLPFTSLAQRYRLVGYNTTAAGVVELGVFSPRLTDLVAGVDAIPPAILSVTPSNGSFVSRTFRFEAVVSDNVAVRHVDFYVDDVLQARLEDPVYARAVDTFDMADGIHIFKVVAFDFTNNSAEQSEAFIIDNISPEIVAVHYTPEVPTNSLSIVVTVQVNDADSGVQSVLLSYNYVGGIFENVTMDRVSGDLYEAVIGPFFTKQILLRVYVSDFSGNVFRSPTILVPVVIDVPIFPVVWLILPCLVACTVLIVPRFRRRRCLLRVRIVALSPFQH